MPLNDGIGIRVNIYRSSYKPTEVTVIKQTNSNVLTEQEQMMVNYIKQYWSIRRITGKDPFKSAYDVMNNWGANHGAISYGHIGADLITMASMLRIPVCMHNVDEKDIYRPSAWNAFGMDKEGQDYRACQAYGPMYKNIR